MKTSFKVIIISVLIFTMGCSGTYLYEELSYIHKGMNLEEVVDVISSSNYSKGLDILNSNIDKDLHILKDNSQILVTEKYSPIENEYYIFMFKENKLLFWGLPYQFMNNSNPTIKNASIEISAILNEKYIEE